MYFWSSEGEINRKGRSSGEIIPMFFVKKKRFRKRLNVLKGEAMDGIGELAGNRF